MPAFTHCNLLTSVHVVILTPLPSPELRVREPTPSKKRPWWLNSIDGNHFFKRTFFHCVCTQEAWADTQTLVLADDQQPDPRWQWGREKQGGDTEMSSQLQNC